MATRSKRISTRHWGMVTLNNKTLYLALKRFEEMGAVTRQVIVQDGKPNRHLYELTERGIEVLQNYLRDFGPEQAGNDSEFFTRISFFDFLEMAERKAILRERLAYLQRGLTYLRSLQQIAEEGEDCAKIVPTLSHAERALAFHTKRIHEEYEWIATWLEERIASRKNCLCSRLVLYPLQKRMVPSSRSDPAITPFHKALGQHVRCNKRGR